MAQRTISRMATVLATRRGTIAAIAAVTVATGLLTACGDTAAKNDTSWIDDSITQLHPLGWLGGRAHPATRNVAVPDPDRADRTIVTGGMVVAELMPEAPLARAGVERGDVIVGVADAWLPNKEDPSPDLFRLVESEISAGVPAVDLAVLRGGAVRRLAVEHGRAPLEVGLPGPSERIAAMASLGLDRLASLQESDGSFPGAETPDEAVSVCAIAGLAFLAGGSTPEEGPHAAALERCRARVEALITDESNELGTWSIAWATMFLAELAGPLEVDMSAMLAGAVPAGGAMTFGGDGPPGGMPPGTIVIGRRGGEGGEPFEIPEGGMVFHTDPTPLPAGHDPLTEPPPMPELPPELANLTPGEGTVITFSGAMMPGAPMDGMPGSRAAPTPMEEVDGPLWSLDEVSMLAGPDAAQRLETLAKAAERLIAQQAEESGGWDREADERGYSDRTLATNQALLALGAAQRAGAPIDEAVLRRALAFVRTHTNDGHVFVVDDPGFDRRREAGRSSGAAAALFALNCTDTDEFLRDLVSYSDAHGKTIPAAGAAVPLHVLNTAILRRHRGLDAWAMFFEEFRLVLVSLQDPDGTFAPLPGAGAGDRGALFDTPAARTAVWSLVAALQSDGAPILTARAANPLQPPMSSDGARLAGTGPTMSGPPMPMDEEQMRKMLEAAGIDLDG